MCNNDEILSELKSLNSALGNLTTENVYIVPVDYFNNLTKEVLKRIKASEATNVTEELKYLSDTLHNISKQTPYSPPEYNFNSTINNNSVKQELESISPLLSSLNKKNPYSVPTGYFNSTIAAKNNTSTPSKIVVLFHKRWMKIAATLIAVVIATVTIKIFTENKSTYKDPIAGVRKDIKQLDNTQKDNLIEILDMGFDLKETAGINNDAKMKEIQQLLKDIPEEELTDFQNQTKDMGNILMTQYN